MSGCGDGPFVVLAADTKGENMPEVRIHHTLNGKEITPDSVAYKGDNIASSVQWKRSDGMWVNEESGQQVEVSWKYIADDGLPVNTSLGGQGLDRANKPAETSKIYGVTITHPRDTVLTLTVVGTAYGKDVKDLVGRTRKVRVSTKGAAGTPPVPSESSVEGRLSAIEKKLDTVLERLPATVK